MDFTFLEFIYGWTKAELKLIKQHTKTSIGIRNNDINTHPLSRLEDYIKLRILNQSCRILYDFSHLLQQQLQ